MKKLLIGLGVVGLGYAFFKGKNTNNNYEKMSFIKANDGHSGGIYYKVNFDEKTLYLLEKTSTGEVKNKIGEHILRSLIVEFKNNMRISFNYIASGVLVTLTSNGKTEGTKLIKLIR